MVVSPIRTVEGTPTGLRCRVWARRTEPPCARGFRAGCASFWDFWRFRPSDELLSAVGSRIHSGKTSVAEFGVWGEFHFRSQDVVLMKKKLMCGPVSPLGTQNPEQP